MVDLLKDKYDIVIVGSGLAGASTAYYSKIFDKEKSKKILLVESLNQNNFTRYHHMCGEAVSKYIIKDFPEFDISKFSKNKIHTISEYWATDVQIKSKSPGYIIDRPKFISHIVEKFIEMNGDIFNDRAIYVNDDKKYIRLKLLNKGNISTKFVVICTGPNIPTGVNNMIKGDIFHSLLYQVLLKKYPLDEGNIEFYYDEKYKDNYKWIFPYGKHVKIGLPYENKEELYNYDKYNIIRKDIKAVTCGILEKYYHNNILFVGDSAFQNNPLTKGGIRNAIHAGKIAAESIIKYNEPKKYDELWKKSRFYNLPYLKTSKKLKQMKNKELIRHSKPFKYYPFSLPLLLVKYRKYFPLYKTYISSGKYGW